MFPLLLIGLIIGIVILAGCQIPGRRTTTSGSEQRVVTSTNLNPAELQRRLEALAKSPTPGKLREGAMCYDMGSPPDAMDYMCPLCMQKTLYVRKNDFDVYSIVYGDLPRCRSLAKDLALIRARLDESSFCSHCTPKEGQPALALIIQLDCNGPEHRISPIKSFDLGLLKDFLAGKDKHSKWNDEEVALKDFTKRLSELLGLKMEVR